MREINNHRFYKKAIQKYGVSAKGVHWISQETQYIRFEVLNSFIKEELVNSHIVDVGCGFGEYWNYLKKSNLKPKSYLGIDVEKQMIKLCKLRFEDEAFIIKDVLKDELPKADYYICSGAMNILKKEKMFLFIQKCLNASKKGFVFNFLKNETLNGVDYKEVLKFCYGLDNNLKIKDYYLQNDISVFMKNS